MPLSPRYQDKTLDAVLGDAHSSTWPDTFYIELYTVAPDPTDGGGTVTAYGEYARVSLDNDSTQFPDAADDLKANSVQIDFPTPWGSAWQGLWSNAVDYSVGDVVQHGLAYYVANNGGTNHEPPNVSFWDTITLVPIVAIALHDHPTDDAIVCVEILPDSIEPIPGAPMFVGIGALAFVSPL